MDKITFRGISNVDYNNLFVSDIGKKKKPEEIVIEHKVSGRSGTLDEHTGQYEEYERVIELSDRDGIHDLSSWLQGKGKLELSTEPNGYYQASIIKSYDHQIHRGMSLKTYDVHFKVQPFFYLNKGNKEINITEYTELVNVYGLSANPLIKVIGTGDLSFYFNDKLVKLFDVNKLVYIDSELLTSYSDIKEIKHIKMQGSYPILRPGINTIIPAYGELKIIPRWCKL